MGLTPAKDSIDIGILVRDIKKSLDFYEGTGCKFQPPQNSLRLMSVKAMSLNPR